VATGGEVPSEFLPNGFALEPGGSFLIANLGPAGGVHRLHRDGRLEPFLVELDGRRLPPANFVNRDETGRVWISFSTWHVPREQAFRRGVADGFIVLVDDRGARVAAEGLGFTNENKLDPSGRWLYVNETIARRLSRFPVAADGRLGPREAVREFGGDGIFPDGLEFDEAGGIWIASVVSNRLVRLGPDGDATVVLDDSRPEAVAAAEVAWAGDRFAREHIDAGRDGVLGNLASVTFGGPERRTAYLGSLFSARIATFPSPVRGARPPHWGL